MPPPVRLLPAALVRVAEKSQAPPAAPGQDQRPDGTLVADVASVSGLLGLDRRRLLPDPGAYWRELATRPELLGPAPKTA